MHYYFSLFDELTNFLFLRSHPYWYNIVCIYLKNVINYHLWIANLTRERNYTWQNGMSLGIFFFKFSIQDEGTLKGEKSVTTASSFSSVMRFGIQVWDSPRSKWNGISSFLHSASTSSRPRPQKNSNLIVLDDMYSPYMYRPTFEHKSKMAYCCSQKCGYQTKAHMQRQFELQSKPLSVEKGPIIYKRDVSCYVILTCDCKDQEHHKPCTLWSLDIQ